MFGGITSWWNSTCDFCDDSQSAHSCWLVETTWTEILNMKMWSLNTECNIYSSLMINFFCLYFKAQTVKILSVIYRLVQSDSFATKRFILAFVNTDMWCSLCIRYLLRMLVLFLQRHLLRQHSAVWLPEICGQYRGRHLLLAEGSSQGLTCGRCAFVISDKTSSLFFF